MAHCCNAGGNRMATRARQGSRFLFPVTLVFAVSSLTSCQSDGTMSSDSQNAGPDHTSGGTFGGVPESSLDAFADEMNAISAELEGEGQRQASGTAATDAGTPLSSASPATEVVWKNENERVGASTPNGPRRTGSPVIGRGTAGGTRTGANMSTNQLAGRERSTANSERTEPPTPRVSAPEPPSTLELAVSLSSQLARDANGSTTPMREWLTMSSLLMVDPSRKPDLKQFGDLDEFERAVLSSYSDHFASVGRIFDEDRDIERLIEETEKLSRSLAAERNLKVTTFELCNSVANYGSYSTIEKDSFVRGRPHGFYAYVEIENFKSKTGDDGLYHTRLTQQIDLYTESDGTLVHSIPPSTSEDVCRRMRRDYFNVQYVELPANLSLGRYNLKVRIRDEFSLAESESVYPITIVASHIGG